MNYKITSHYARGEEQFIAEFIQLNDAQFFIKKRAAIDEIERKQIIYRLYDDQELVHELNTENISITHANYAEDNRDFNNAAPFIFHVMIKTFNSEDGKIIAQFRDKKDAGLFVDYKFKEDTILQDNDLLLIFKGKVLIDTVNKTKIAIKNKESSGIGKESPYKLSPLSTRPTPGGGPADFWVKDEGNE